MGVSIRPECFLVNRCASMDPRATPRLRVDHDVPTHQRQSLTHTDEAETPTCPGCLEVEPLSSVADQKIDLRRRLPSVGLRNAATPLCFAALWSASWRTRKRQREMSDDTWSGTSRTAKSISTCFWCENSWQKLPIAVATPRTSSFDECNSCARAWISVAISTACSFNLVASLS